MRVPIDTFILQRRGTRLSMVSIHRKHDKMSTEEPMQVASGSSTQGTVGSSHNLPPNIVTISQVALQRKADEANSMYESCVSCGRRCEDNRAAGKLGKCRTGMKAFVSSHFPHTGEETCLVGTNGSGTIFFANCNLKVHSLNEFAKYTVHVYHTKLVTDILRLIYNISQTDTYMHHAKLKMPTTIKHTLKQMP